MIVRSNTPQEYALSLPQKLLSISGVSQLRFSDDQLLSDMLKKNEVRYTHSFLYLLRASHGRNGELGYKYINSDVIAIIGYRHNGIYVTPIFDLSKGIKLQELCENLAKTVKLPILLKKFSNKDFSHMTSILTPQKTTLIEDDTCPETTLSLQKLFSSNGEIRPQARRFRQKVNRFEKFKIDVELFDNLKHFSLEDLAKLLRKDEEKYANYIPVITYLYGITNTDNYRLIVFRYNQEIKGIYITEFLSPTELGLYCSVNAKDKPGSTEWMDWYFFRKMFLEGVEKIYFGGAENKGVDYYIKKLLPDKPHYSVTTVAYIPEQARV